jgi:hypothetical protein
METFRNLGLFYDNHSFQRLKFDWYSEAVLHAERSLLNHTRALFDTFVEWTCSISSTCMQLASTATKVLLIGGLPLAYAAPTGGNPTTESLSNPERWVNIETLYHLTAWASAIVLGALIIYPGVRGPRKELRHYCVFSFGSAGTSLVLLNDRAPPEVGWPTLVVGIVFLIRLWVKVSELYEMSHGWLGFVLGLGILIDVGFVRLMVGGPRRSSGPLLSTTAGLFLPALSLCAGMAWFLRQINANESRDEVA